MKYLRWIFLLIILILTTGCWNYRELNELAIVGAIGVDIEDDQYKVSVEIINVKKVASNSTSGSSMGNESPVAIYEAYGKTIKEAINNIVLEAPNIPYIAHLNLLVFSDKAARKGIEDFIGYFIGDPESRKVFPTIVVKNGNASDILKILLPLETVPSINNKKSLEATASINGAISNRLFDEVLMCLYIDGRNPTISSVEIIGDPKVGEQVDDLSSTKPKSSVKISGSAVFKKDKLIGYLDITESLAYTIIRDKATTISLSFPCDDKNNFGNVVIDSVKNSMKIKIVDNKPVNELVITGKAALPEYNCKADLTDPKTITKIQDMANKELEKIIGRTISKVQKEFNSDIFGFGEYLYKNNYKYWIKNKKNWDKIFPNMKYKVKTKVVLESVDSRIKSAKDR